MNLLSFSTGNQIASLSQMSWLMKTAAIELRVTSLNRQRSHTQRLVSLLLDDQPHPQHTGECCTMLMITISVQCKLFKDIKNLAVLQI